MAGDRMAGVNDLWTFMMWWVSVWEVCDIVCNDDILVGCVSRRT